MNTERGFAGAIVGQDVLLQLQLQVARRADEIARARRSETEGASDLECWLEAEREVWAVVPEPVAS